MSETTLFALFLVGAMIIAVLFAWAMCRAAARADADWEQFIAGGWSVVSLQSLPKVPSRESRESEESCPNT